VAATTQSAPAKDADGTAILESCHRRRSGRYADIGPLVERLRELGWNEERLVKNDLIEPRGIAGRQWDHGAFWSTIARLADELRQMGLPPIFIKCARDYPYCDSNVDLLVPRRRLREVARRLWASDWLKPELWDAFEQLLIERAKLKLPSRTPGLVTAHLYGGVSWRYQGDIGLLRLDGTQANPEHLSQVEVADCVPEGTSIEPSAARTKVWLPSDESEMVMQAAHIAYENFRITIGEALHFRLMVLRAPGALDSARALAEGYGCGCALDLLDNESRRVVDGLLAISPNDYPRTLPAETLLPAFRDRARYLTRRGRRLAAMHERWSMHLVYRLVSVIRKVRRWRRGAEDYRH